MRSILRVKVWGVSGILSLCIGVVFNGCATGFVLRGGVAMTSPPRADGLTPKRVASPRPIAAAQYSEMVGDTGFEPVTSCV